MKLDLQSVEGALTVGAGVAELASRVIGHVREVDCFEKLGPVLDDLALGVPAMVEAVKAGTVAADEPPGLEAERERELEEASGSSETKETGADEAAGEQASAGDGEGSAETPPAAASGEATDAKAAP